MLKFVLWSESRQEYLRITRIGTLIFTNDIWQAQLWADSDVATGSVKKMKSDVGPLQLLGVKLETSHAV